MSSPSRTTDAPGAAHGPEARPTKGQATRAAILDAALTHALHAGLEGLSIGQLAERTGMSKSGVFAHFGSREDLQIAVIHEYHRRFSAEVFEPALRQRRGLPRLRALFENWLERVTAELAAGCIYISGAVEFDDRPGAVRDALVAMVDGWHAALERAIALAVSEGHLRADADPAQLRFEIHGLILAVHHDARLLRRTDAPRRARLGFLRIVEHWAAGPAAPADDPMTPPAARG
jgi:AcrR family transcriptional regulator